MSAQSSLRGVSFSAGLLLSSLSGCGASQASGGDAGASDLAAPVDLPIAGDLAVPTTPRLLAAGHYMLSGITSDDYALMFIPVQSGAFAVSVFGGDVETVDPAAAITTIAGARVFAWANVDGNATGDLAVWTAALGNRKLATRSPLRLAASSGDQAGAYIAWLAQGDGQVADLHVARADGTGGKRVYIGLPISGGCRPTMAFVPNTPELLISHCVTSDAGAMTWSVSSVDARTGAALDLQGDASDFFALDPTGSLLVVADAKGQGTAMKLDGSAPRRLDDLEGGYFAIDSSAFVYSWKGALRRFAFATGQVVTLQWKNVSAIKAVSWSSDWVIFSQNGGPQNLSDLFLASALTPGDPVMLSSGVRGAVRGDAFTRDSTRALFLGNVLAPNVGELDSIPVRGGPMATHGSTVRTVRAVRGTQVVFNDHYAAAAQSLGRADILTVDTASGNDPVPIVRTAEVDFFLSSLRDRVIYSDQSRPGQEGVYVIGIPPIN